MEVLDKLCLSDREEGMALVIWWYDEGDCEAGFLVSGVAMWCLFDGENGNGEEIPDVIVGVAFRKGELLAAIPTD